MGSQRSWADRRQSVPLPKARDWLSASLSGSRGSPPANRPNCHAFSPTLPATAYLGIPAGPELVRPLVRGVLAAIQAEAAEPLGPIAQKNFVAPRDGGHRRPIAERGKYSLPEVETNSSLAAETLLHRGETNAIENVAESERRR